MAKPLADDELWAIIKPLLPEPKSRRFRFPCRKPIDNRRALTVIVFVLKTGIGWEDLPQEMGCGSGMTCWRRSQDWQTTGVWRRLHEVLLARLHGAGQIDWSRAVVANRLKQFGDEHVTDIARQTPATLRVATAWDYGVCNLAVARVAEVIIEDSQGHEAPSDGRRSMAQALLPLDEAVNVMDRGIIG
jgi:transposase